MRWGERSCRRLRTRAQWRGTNWSGTKWSTLHAKDVAASASATAFRPPHVRAKHHLLVCRRCVLAALDGSDAAQWIQAYGQARLGIFERRRLAVADDSDHRAIALQFSAKPAVEPSPLERLQLRGRARALNRCDGGSHGRRRLGIGGRRTAAERQEGGRKADPHCPGAVFRSLWRAGLRNFRWTCAGHRHAWGKGTSSTALAGSHAAGPGRQR